MSNRPLTSIETLADAISSGRLTVPVSVAATAADVSRQVLYREIADERFPGVRLGSNRIVVPIGKLLDYLGFDPDAFIKAVLDDATLARESAVASTDSAGAK